MLKLINLAHCQVYPYLYLAIASGISVTYKAPLLALDMQKYKKWNEPIFLSEFKVYCKKNVLETSSY